MRYIVTGGAGFIGSYIAKALIKRGDEVIVIDNLATGKVENIPHGCKVISGAIGGNIINREAFQRALEAYGDVDGVFHCAAQARIQPSIKAPAYTYTSNTLGTFTVLEEMRKHGINNIVFSSSSSIYGRNECVEDGSVDCLNPYSVSKYAGEQYCRTWGKLYGINNVSLRYFNVYGPGSYIETEYAPIPGLFYRQALKEKRPITIVGNGMQRRDFTHVEDVVEANLLAMENASKPDVNGNTFNVGTGKNYSILEVAEMVLHSVQLGAWHMEFISEREAEANDTLANNRKAANLLGWHPIRDIKHEVSDLAKYYREKWKDV